MPRQIPFRCFLWMLGSSVCVPVAAEEYPARPIRVVVPQAAGSSTDIVARVFADQVGAKLKQPIVVEPRPGAGGRIGAALVAKAAPDGHTLMMANSGPLSINPGLYRSLQYDPITDFAPVSITAMGPYVLVAHPSLPIASVKQLVELARRRPGELTFASGGSGTGTHLSGELLKQITQMHILHVPYKGTGPGLVDLVSGHVSVSFAGVPPALPHIRSKRARALGVTGSKRSPVLPDVPTIMESGVGNYEVNLWLGLVAPAGTPMPIVQKLNTLVRDALGLPEIRQRMGALGLEATTNSPEEFSRYLRSEIERWRQVIAKAGITVE